MILVGQLGKLRSSGFGLEKHTEKIIANAICFGSFLYPRRYGEG